MVTVSDLTPPRLSTATVDGTTLTLTYNEALEETQVPAGSAFTVTVDGSGNSVTAVDVAGSTVALTLTTAVSVGATVTVSYTAPAANRLRDEASNAAADFAGQAVTFVDTTAPSLSTAMLEAGASTLTLTYNEALDPASVPVTYAFRVTVDWSGNRVTAVDIRGSTVELTLTAAVRAGSTVRVAYTWPGVNGIQDLAGNRAADSGRQAVTVVERRNRAPVAEAGEDLRVVPMAAVTLDGSGSGDPDGDPLRFAWIQVSGEAVELTGADTAQASFDAPEDSGELVFRLTVSDPGGLQDSDEVRVTVSGPSDATLSALAVTSGGAALDLSPAFSSSTYAYEVRLDAGTTSARVTVTKSHPAATLAASLAVTGLDPVPVTITSGTEVTLTGLKDGRNVLSITVTAEDGVTKRDYTLTLAVGAQWWEAHGVPLFVSAYHPSGHEGFVRIVNRSQRSGEVRIDAVDDLGMPYGPVTLVLDANETVHLNSGDLEEGNPDKGLASGIGAGSGDWRLRSQLALDVLANRTEDGLLAPLHDLVPTAVVRRPGTGEEAVGHEVAVFNPARNVNQVSRLRITNRSDTAPAQVVIEGIDDAGATPGPGVALELPAGASRTLTSRELESGEGEGLTGRLGDGRGKWRLVVTTDQPVEVMSLLSTPTGHLVNLSTAAPVAVAAPVASSPLP